MRELAGRGRFRGQERLGGAEFEAGRCPHLLQGHARMQAEDLHAAGLRGDSRGWPGR